MKDPMCADCAGWDIEWMRECKKHKGVKTCRGCVCPYCAEDDFMDNYPESGVWPEDFDDRQQFKPNEKQP